MYPQGRSFQNAFDGFGRMGDAGSLGAMDHHVSGSAAPVGNPMGAGPAAALYKRLYGRGDAPAGRFPGGGPPRAQGGHPPQWGGPPPPRTRPGPGMGGGMGMAHIFRLLQQGMPGEAGPGGDTDGLDQHQYARMMAGEAPGGFGGAFRGLSPAMRQAIAQMMQQEDQGTTHPGYGLGNMGLPEFIHALMGEGQRGGIGRGRRGFQQPQGPPRAYSGPVM